jgi:protein-tyrosine phosphatase
VDLVDLHSHLLPALDDGPAALDETIAVLRAAHATGVRRIAATPHMFVEPWNHRDPGRIRDAFARTWAAIQERAESDRGCAFVGEIQVDLGAENYASPDLLTAIDRDRVLTLNGSRYLLVEFPLLLPAAAIVTILRRIRDAGLRPVVAHVERYAAFQDRPRDLESLRDEGSILQVNAQSLMERRSPSLQRQCIDLLAHGIVQVVASDVHGPALRRPHLGAALALLGDELPVMVLRACFRDNPRRILDDETLD